MDDLLNEFLEETNDSLIQLDQDFVELEQDPENQEIVKNIFRVMHTVKGTSGFLGFSRLEKVGHSAENLMDKVRNGEIKVTDDLVSLVLEATDRIKEIVEGIEENGQEVAGDDSSLINDLDNYQASSSAENSSENNDSEFSDDTNSESSKTPDLDEEIDFTPIAADFADDVVFDGDELKNSLSGDELSESSSDDLKLKNSQFSKTPDLDEEIDFTPIAADFADDVVFDGDELKNSLSEEESEDKNSNEKSDDSKLVSKELSEQDKKKVVEAGLKATEKDNSQPAKKPKPQQSIRVNIEVLENLMQFVGELVLTRNQLLQLKRSESEKVKNNFSTSLQRLNIITTELQEGVMKTRMQPISSIWAKFPRVIRDLSKDLGKKIKLHMIGEDTELDRQMLESIRDPLTHMIRNAADHGVEGPEDRSASGKPEEGNITLSAYHEGGHIIIKITDDGKGINTEVVKKRAVERGLVTAEEIEKMSDRQIFQFIFKPGFSTAEAVTSISGRGVGMDVVLTNIEKIGGTLEVDSVYGKGSEFSIKLPLTLAIMPVLTLQTAEEKFAIPQIMVSEIVRVEGKNHKSRRKNKFKSAEEAKTHKVEIINDSPVLRLRDKLLSLISLSDVLQMSRETDSVVTTNGKEIDKETFVVVCEVGSSTFGILVDKVFHTEEIVVKPKSKLVENLDVFAGSTILGDGSVILIIDLNGLLRLANIGSIESENKVKERKSVFDEDEISFLLFRTNEDTPKAIPLELVSRLEEINFGKIEKSGGKKVVQYRDKLMRLISIDQDQQMPNEKIHDTIVFSDRKRVLGVYVKEIIDIVKQKMDLQSISGKEGVLGSMVMKGQATEIIDISYFISKEFDDWLGHSEANKLEQHIEQEFDDRKHVLLVDDSAFFRKFMRPVILAAGFRVTTCEDGQEALDVMKENLGVFDVVITDIDMPRMNGVEFVTEAKKIEEIAKVPFIALTSHEEDDFEKDIHELGFENLVTKANRNKVINLITEILKDKKVQNG